MKTARALAAAACVAGGLSFPGHGLAAPINLATGLDGAGNFQTANDALDANWQVTGANNPQDAPNAYVVGDYAPDSGDPYWGPNGPTSSWIAANPNDPRGNGAMTFTRTFDVSDPSIAAIVNGSWVLDDLGTLFLNGNVLAILGNGRQPAYALYSFTTTPSNFIVGVNHAERNSDHRHGQLGRRRAATGRVCRRGRSCYSEMTSTWTMLLIGFGGLGLAGYRWANARRSVLAA